MLPLMNDSTLLQDTLLRLDGLASAGLPPIICNEDRQFLVAVRIRQVERQAEPIVLEPFGRNTAPAIASRFSADTGSCQSRCQLELAEVPSSLRTLGRGLTHRRGHLW